MAGLPSTHFPKHSWEDLGVEEKWERRSDERLYEAQSGGA